MRPDILNKIEKLGHAVFEGDNYDLNIIGVRTASRIPNSFNDYLMVVFKENGAWKEEVFAVTTDPGTYWLENPSKVKGTAILVPGQYRGVYKIDKHGGKYEALCQRNGPVKVYRDSNKNGILDMDASTIESGSFGINIHHASYTGTSTKVDKWSAGCQVFASIYQFNRFMELCKLQQKHHPGWKTYTYTLVDEKDI